MRICVFEVREDEREDLAEVADIAGAEVCLHGEVPSMENVELVRGCEGVSILGQGAITADLLDAWAGLGVRYLSTRTIGYDHIDLAAAGATGIRVCNASYPPSGVAEFTVMLMLMCLRNYKQSLWRGQVNDFSLDGLEGWELGDQTVGVLGTGRIGRAVIGILEGFGCRIVAYDPHPKQDLACRGVEYLSFDGLLAESTVITLHVPLTQDTYHLVCDETIAKMRDGVTIINCARGGLADMGAMIRGIESGKIGALGLDVVEGEEGITHVDHRVDILANQQMAYLRQFRNVIMTPHMAFYTDRAVRSMAECGIGGIVDMAAGRECANELHPVA